MKLTFFEDRHAVHGLAEVRDEEPVLARLAGGLETDPGVAPRGGGQLLHRQLVQQLPAARRLAGLRLVGREAADEVLQFLDLLLGLLVLVLYELLDELAGLVPEVVVADVHLYLAVVYVHDVRADVVEEVAVVADHEHGALVVHEEVLEPDDALEVEVVRGLVEQDDVRLAEERLGQQHLDLEARVHVGHERVVEGGVHAEALEYLARVRLGLPAAELRELLLELRGADAVLVREVGLFVDGVLLLAALVQARVPHYDGVEHSVGVVHALILLKYGHAGLGVHIDVPARGVDLAREYFEEGGLALRRWRRLCRSSCRR